MEPIDSSLTAFVNARVDGGVRSGVDQNGELLLHHLEPGTGEPDPALAWYADVSFAGAPSFLPDRSQGAREWLLRRSPDVRRVLLQLAQRLECGADADWPVTSGTIDLGDGVSMVVTCSAVRRLEARRLGGYLRELAATWAEDMRHLHACADSREVV